MNQFEYNLPPEKIALFPPTSRGQSRLLVVDRNTSQITDSWYRELWSWLHPGTVLVRNTTKVLPARIKARSERTKHEIELLFLEKHRSLETKAIAKGSVKSGDRLWIGNAQAVVMTKSSDGVLELQLNTQLTSLLDQYGQAPIPPYLKRDSTTLDLDRYQTVFAKEAGSVAAPTASLNFTPELEDKLRQGGVMICDLVLHVGLGTFQPIRGGLDSHKMHEEYFQIPAATIDAILAAKQARHPILALGTTVTRALEHSYHSWQPGQDSQGEANIFIYPGYRFQVVDHLLTNFHAPGSTVLQLAAAMAGSSLLAKAYQHALDHDYRFLSYGDSMLIV